MVYECGASLDIKNRQGLTPLTLAAKLAMQEVSINFSICYYSKVTFIIFFSDQFTEIVNSFLRDFFSLFS